MNLRVGDMAALDCTSFVKMIIGSSEACKYDLRYIDNVGAILACRGASSAFHKCLYLAFQAKVF